MPINLERKLCSVGLFLKILCTINYLVRCYFNFGNIIIKFQEIIQDRDEERERLRRELQRAQDQVHTLMSHSSVRTSSLSVTSPTSRPASYISIEESSGPETSERNLESEDDGKKRDFFNTLK